MSGQAKLLGDNLDTLDQQFYLVMDRYLHALTQYYISEDEENRLKLEGVQAQLNPIYQKTLILASTVEAAIDTAVSKSNKMDGEISQLKVEYDDLQKRLIEVDGSNLAAPPLKKELRHDMVKAYFYAGYYSIAIVLGSYFIYKKLKS